MEGEIRVAGEYACERRLARTGRPVEHQRRETARIEHASQHAAWPEKIVLTQNLVERLRAHTHRQRGMLVQRALFRLVKQIHAESIPYPGR